MPPNFATTWLAAADANYVRPGDWQEWADRLILSSDNLPNWLLDMAVAQDSEHLLLALQDIKIEENGRAGFCLPELTLGFMYLGYLESDDDVRKLLMNIEKSGLAEACFEAAFGLLTEIEKRDRNLAEIEDLVKEAQRLLTPFGDIAFEAWREICDFRW